MKKEVKVSTRLNPAGRGRQKFAYLTRGDRMKSNAIGRRLAEAKSAAQARKEVLAAAGAKKVTEKKQPKNGPWIEGAERPSLWLYDHQLKAVKDWKAGDEVVLVITAKVKRSEVSSDKDGEKASARLEITEIGTI
jgi:hypothetical protein